MYDRAYQTAEQQTRLADLGDDFTSELTERWLITVGEGTTDEQIHALCETSNCLFEGHPSEGGVPFFQILATEVALEQVLQQAAADGVKVDFVEPDMLWDAVPIIEADDLEDEVGAAAATWGLNKIGAPGRSDGRGTHIYVMDTGIRRTHRDFGGRVTMYLDYAKGGNPVCSSNSCAQDRHGHGTHCAATAAGATYGVATRASIYAVKGLDDGGRGQDSWFVS